MRRRAAVLLGTLSLLTLGLHVGSALGQQQGGVPETAPQAPEDTLELVFEREVFSYPGYERRNPFRPLTGEDQGPRFEDLTLLGVLVSMDPQSSIATVGVRQPGTRQQAPTRIVRLRPGEILGNSRILEVRDEMVLVQVEEFGLFDMRTLVLRRAEPQRQPRPPGVPAPAGPPADTLLDGDPEADPAPELSLKRGFDRERAGGALTDRTMNGNGGLS